MVESLFDWLQSGVFGDLGGDVLVGPQVRPGLVGLLASIPRSWNADDSSPFWVTWQMKCHLAILSSYRSPSLFLRAPPLPCLGHCMSLV